MDVIATRCHDTTEAYKTQGTSWSAIFTTEVGGEVVIHVNTTSNDAELHGTLGPALIKVSVSYIDKSNYFSGADRLFPYITILKARYPNQGTPFINVDGGMRTMEKKGDGLYEVTFMSSLDSSYSLHQEMIAGLTMAFTASYPHTGQAPWDSNGHKNHGFWLR